MYIYIYYQSWACDFKNAMPQKQNAISNPRVQNAIALLNYLKRIAPQQLTLIMQVFTETFLKRKELNRYFFK
jgi:hypothetical protein